MGTIEKAGRWVDGHTGNIVGKGAHWIGNQKLIDLANKVGFKACFVAGTPIKAVHGSKPIEDFRSYEEHGDECDWVWSLDEHDPEGELRLRRVLRRFVRESLVLNLHVGGRIIGTTTSGYDALNRLTGRQFANGTAEHAFAYGYDDAGRVETLSRYEDAAATVLVGTTTFDYDELGRTAEITHTAGSTLLAAYDYEYDALDRVKSDTGKVFDYDDASQLTSDNGSSLDYDGTGNRNGTGYVVGDGNRLLESPGWVYTYDLEGNQETAQTLGPVARAYAPNQSEKAAKTFSVKVLS